MKLLVPFVICALVLALLLFLIFDLGERALEPSPVAAKTEQQQWGREAANYVVEAPSSTTVPARARTAPNLRTASFGPVVLAANVNGYPCGGVELPPCSVMRRESGGDPSAYNAHGCNGHGCYGLWQFSGEWACHFGLSCDIAHWTADEQEQAARTLWDSGHGCAHWDACV